VTGERMRLITFRSSRRAGSTLRGGSTVVLPVFELEIRIVRCTSAPMNGRPWAALPGKAQINASGELIRNDRGRIAYTPIGKFRRDKVREAFSARVVELVAAWHPEALQ
jgi:hypothetical protein